MHSLIIIISILSDLMTDFNILLFVQDNYNLTINFFICITKLCNFSDKTSNLDINHKNFYSYHLKTFNLETIKIICIKCQFCVLLIVIAFQNYFILIQLIFRLYSSQKTRKKGYQEVCWLNEVDDKLVGMTMIIPLRLNLKFWNS